MAKEMECFEYVPETEVSSNTSSKPDRGLVQSEDVVSEGCVSASAAFEKFAGKVLDGSKEDYTTTPSTTHEGNSVHGYVDPVQETPFERYTRLQSEIKAFQTELGALQKVAGSEELCALMTAELAKIATPFEALGKDVKLAPFLAQYYPLNAKDVQSKNIASDLSTAIKGVSALSVKTEVVGAAKGGENGVTYELYARPEDAKSAGSVDATAVDRRLAALEQSIGLSGGASLPAAFPDILTGVEHLKQKIASLDEHKTGPIMLKVGNLLKELEALEEQKGNLGKGSEHDMKVAQLFNTMSTWDVSAAQLPLIVGRLQSIKDVVEVGAAAPGKLSALEKDHEGSGELLKANQGALAKLTADLGASVKEMEASVGAMETKMSALAGKF